MRVVNRLAAELEGLRARAQLRRLEVNSGIDLSSNDYLGLARDLRLRQTLVAALNETDSVASTGSRLLSGNSTAWMELERDFALFAGTEAALFFSSGYAANLGLLSSILRPDDIVFSDAANHASIIDGIRLAKARSVIYNHLDMDGLEDKLRAHTPGEGEAFIVTESVFSMDGDRAPLEHLVILAERFGAELIVDEAHATGVFGPEGRGLAGDAGLTGRIFAAVHTCGKALAAAGAFVCGTETLKQFLVNRARTFIFSTALPPYLAAQIRAAMRLVVQSDRERAYLVKLSGFLRSRLAGAEFDSGKSDSQIIPVLVGENDAALVFAADLQKAGYRVKAIRPPSVPAGTARLRLSLNATLSFDTLERLVDTMVKTRESWGAAWKGARL